jgi:hypothetical protein
MMNAMSKSTEVSSKARRRQFSVAEKIRILHEADACANEKGALAALLRATAADRSARQADEPDQPCPEATPAAAREDRTARPPAHADHRSPPARNGAEVQAAPLN